MSVRVYYDGKYYNCSREELGLTFSWIRWVYVYSPTALSCIELYDTNGKHAARYDKDGLVSYPNDDTRICMTLGTPLEPQFFKTLRARAIHACSIRT